jgi:hypothetical protein
MSGITESDKRRLRRLSRRRRDSRGEQQVSEDECAEMRERYQDGELVKNDITPDYSVAIASVQKHVHGDCRHPGGARR